MTADPYLLTRLQKAIAKICYIYEKEYDISLIVREDELIFDIVYYSPFDSDFEGSIILLGAPLYRYGVGIMPRPKF